MKTAYKYSVISLLLILASCSKSEGEPEIVTPNYYNKISCDGVQILDATDNFNMRRTDEFMLISYTSYIPGSAFVVDRSVSIKFSLYGGFSQASAQKGTTVYKSFAYDSAANFHFELEQYDQVNNTVKGNYSGKVYVNPEDLNSEFIIIEGSFFLQVGNDEGAGPTAATSLKLKMNGADWRSTVLLNPQEYTYEGTVNYAANQFLSDDKYKIVIGHEDATASAISTHVFDNTNTDFFVKLGKYNAITNQFDYYISSQGILKIDTAGHLPPSGIGYFYTGTFNFTATNPVAPFDVITITDGVITYHD